MKKIILEKVPIEVSNRHLHLSKRDCEALFGYNSV
jgi:propanediol utilization protein